MCIRDRYDLRTVLEGADQLEAWVTAFEAGEPAELLLLGSSHGLASNRYTFLLYDGGDRYPCLDAHAGTSLTETAVWKNRVGWEIAGVVSPKPLPTFPDGFPPEIIRNFEKLTGRKVICNKPYSGTQLLLDYGREHVETGALMVYTSADSVFQVAAHEDIVPIEELYHDCELAREMLTGDYAVGRVIARPFVGEYPNYTRTARRHDYSLQPPRATMLNNLEDAGYECIGVGKISDIFAGSGITHQIRTQNNTDGIAKTLDLMENDFEGICFVNLVDFDMVYGHRNDAPGYARALMEFDQALPKFMEQMGEDDLLIITADHGCDPSTPSTDHSREYTPMLAWSKKIRPGANLGTRTTFADIGATVLEYFGLENRTDGQSFLKEICTKE